MRNERPLALLRLARRLAGSGEGMTLDEMANESGVDRRTAERMRDTIRDLFPQMEEIADGRSKRFRIPGGLDGFAQTPTADELAELEAAIRALEQGGGVERADLLRSLVEKIRAGLRGAARRRIDPDVDALLGAEALVMQVGPRPMASKQTLSHLREALKSMRTCIFDYAGSAGGIARTRQVTPFGILFGKSYYLVGPEVGKTEPVLWRFDRIGTIEFGEPFDGPPDEFDLTAFVARSFGTFQEQPEDITLRFSASSSADARRFQFHPGQTLEDQPDGSLIVRFRAGGFQEMTNHLFSWGDAVDVLAPPRLQNMMINELEKALVHHRRTLTQGSIG
jgi:predicted DNA-binding transcriptional regulator YafY